MSKEQIAIELEFISKTYTINSENNKIFHALKNISFNIKKGEVLGIIGSNGSGKSTLLKIISGITKPTSGKIKIFGQASSILDIGTNFHPDLSGRENVHLQLSIQKKQKSEIEILSEQILAFSEIGTFFDEPIKHYSNGMFLRLAFSLAFHSGNEILILDEVLSVGDESFRLKCQELLRQFMLSGKTIVFVSHTRFEILELCTRCIWIDKGEIIKEGSPQEILGAYLSMQKDNFDQSKKSITISSTSSLNLNGTINLQNKDKPIHETEIFTINEIKVTSAIGLDKIYNMNPILFSFLLEKKIERCKIGVFFFIQDMFYQSVFVGNLLNNNSGVDLSLETDHYKGNILVQCIIPANFLMPGKYYLQLRFGKETGDWHLESEELLRFTNTLSFIVHPSESYIEFIGDSSKGSVRPPLDWSVSKEPNFFQK